MTDENTSNPSKTIDARGLYCPEPVFRTKIEMEKLSIGETIKVIADDPESEEDISRWANRNGHNLISIEKNDGELVFTIKKAK